MDLPINLNTVILGTIIIGMGYLGLIIKHRLMSTNFNELTGLDKIIQSLVFGTITFLLTLQFVVKIPLTEESIINYVLNNPLFFMIQFFFIIISIFFLIAIEDFLDSIFRRQTY